MPHFWRNANTYTLHIYASPTSHSLDARWRAARYPKIIAGAMVDRLTTALAEKLGPAREDGLVRPDLGADDLFLALGMGSDMLAKTPATERRSVADSAWALLRRGLQAPKPTGGMSGSPATARVNGEQT